MPVGSMPYLMRSGVFDSRLFASFPVSSSSGTIERCLIANNSTNENGDGAGVKVELQSNPVFNNCAFAGNTASANAGGGLSSYASTTVVTNSIFWNNQPDQVANSGDNSGFGSTSVVYSNVQGGYEGEGNFDANPEFCNASNGEYAVSESSPCLGAGQDGADVGFSGAECAEPYNNYSLSFDGDDEVLLNDLGAFSNFTINTRFLSNQLTNGTQAIFSINSGSFEFCFSNLTTKRKNKTRRPPICRFPNLPFVTGL